MNATEFRHFIDLIMLLCDEGKRFITSRGDQAGSLLAEWQTQLAEIELCDAKAALSSILNGTVTRPDYFDMGRFPGLVARVARQERQNRLAQQSSRSFDAAGVRYRCNQCRDTGVVTVWNPHFVDEFSDQFASIDKHSTAWTSRAYHWWSQAKADRGPMLHVALCDCDCPRQKIQAEEREKFLAGTRRDTSGKPAGPPACGLAKYNPKTMPLYSGDHYRDLAAWYGSELLAAAG